MTTNQKKLFETILLIGFLVLVYFLPFFALIAIVYLITQDIYMFFKNGSNASVIGIIVKRPPPKNRK